MASSFDLVNRAIEGKLPDRLKEMRADGLSLQQMADRFNADGFGTSLETVRRWCQRIGLPTNRVPAAAPSSAGRGQAPNPLDASGTAPVGGEIEAGAA